MARIVVMGGDGIGPEVLNAACAVLDRVAGLLDFDIASEHHLLPDACWDVHGEWVLDEKESPSHGEQLALNPPLIVQFSVLKGTARGEAEDAVRTAYPPGQ